MPDSDRSDPGASGAAGDGVAELLHPKAAELLRLAREQFPNCDLVLHVRVFGQVHVYFWLPRGIVNPHAINDAALASPKKYVTQTALLYTYGDHGLIVPARFANDGASIPNWLQLVTGYRSLEVHLWADVPHDYICEHPEELPREIGDAIFGHILAQLAAEKKLKRKQALEMFWGVRGYTRLIEWINSKS